jgi:hypothetical protein
MACLTPWDKQTARVFDADGAWHSLFANSDKSGLARDAVLTIRKKKRTYRRVVEDCRGNPLRVFVSGPG